jgi:hypothetical protein
MTTNNTTAPCLHCLIVDVINQYGDTHPKTTSNQMVMAAVAKVAAQHITQAPEEHRPFLVAEFIAMLVAFLRMAGEDVQVDRFDEHAGPIQ